MSEYYLASGVHVGLSADHIVFLDEASGRYLGLPLGKACTLGSKIHEWPAVGVCTDAPHDPALLRSLLEQGLITRDPRLGKPAAPIHVEISNTWHNDRWLAHRPAIRAEHVVRFVFAVIYAALAMRWMPLTRIMHRVRERKHKNAHRAIDSRKLSELMTIYERLRPLLYTRKDACMLHSLAVMEFLAPYGIFPDWILGVRTAPFRAHSWLQSGSIAITDSPLRLARLTPLLKI